MLTYHYPVIAREGWKWIALVIAAASVAYFYVGLVSIPVWALAIFLVFLFRDPHRKVPALPLGIVCPVDGRIVAIEKVIDAYLDRTAVCISIKMSFIDVYSSHSPMEGKIIKQWHETARKIQSLATDKNNGTDIDDGKSAVAFSQWIQSDEGDDVVLVVEAGTFLAKPHCYAHSGERIGQGQRCGFFQFGTRVDVLVPESTRVEVRVGDKVLAGTDIIATLVRADDELSVIKAVTDS